MSDNSDLPRLFIIIDSSLPRCLWCGGPVIVIDNLLSTRMRGAYCSSECRDANTAYDAAIFAGMVLSYIWAFLGWFYPIGIILLILTLLIMPFLLERGRKRRKQAVLRGLRANEQLSVSSLLKTKFPFVKCPNCNEQLNLSMIGEDGLYQCQYCDATGIIEIEFTGRGPSSQ